uniref:SH2 domain-containing protein n=1 Tax=Acrobeloides nanus TaxID=290746 RepID=A0A914D3U0_9BILA
MPQPPVILKDCSNEKDPTEKEQSTTVKTTRKPIEPKLEFDEKLQESIYSIGEYMDEQLQELAYFCRNPRKEEVMNHLLSMPEGAFVLRYSESRKRCLALSVRVPKSHGSGSGISHYLIVWNEKGFRIKGSKRYFQTIPMMITHHTVISEQLPCRLVFIELDSSIIKHPNSSQNGAERRAKHDKVIRSQEDSKTSVNASASSTEINRTVVKMARRSSSFMIAQR